MRTALRHAALAMLVAAMVPGRAVAEPNPSFVLTNRMPVPMAEFFAVPSGSTGWGPPRVGLATGGSVAVSIRPGACVWDLRATFLGAAPEERRAVNLCETTDIVFGGAPDRAAQIHANPSFNLVNRSDKHVVEVYASPSSFANWGQNRATGGQVAPGAALAVRLPSGECVHDVRAVFADGAVAERRGVDTCAISSLSLP